MYVPPCSDLCDIFEWHLSLLVPGNPQESSLDKRASFHPYLLDQTLPESPEQTANMQIRILLIDIKKY